MKNTWTTTYKTPQIRPLTAVVGSPGLRSIGKLVTDRLIQTINAELIGEIFSTHFPVIYQTKPAYASHPQLPGIGAITISSGTPQLPSVKFYYSPSPLLLIVDGYHSNFAGQYEVGENVLDFFEDAHVQRIIVVAGYGLKGNSVCCAATNQKMLTELEEKYALDVGYEGPFYGFSGILFGLAKIRGIKAFTLFGKTTPNPEDPEKPDEEAALAVIETLKKILQISEL